MVTRANNTCPHCTGDLAGHELCRVEARARLDRAMQDVEAAQNLLHRACSELSALLPGTAPSPAKLADGCRALWYRLKDWGLHVEDKLDLDSITGPAHLKRLSNPLPPEAK